MSFIVNTTDSVFDWIPLRQVGRDISDDYTRYQDAVSQDHGPVNYSTLSNWLSTILVREGPTLSLAGGAYRGGLSVAILGDQKSVRCYRG